MVTKYFCRLNKITGWHRLVLSQTSLKYVYACHFITVHRALIE